MVRGARAPAHFGLLIRLMVTLRRSQDGSNRSQSALFQREQDKEGRCPSTVPKSLFNRGRPCWTGFQETA